MKRLARKHDMLLIGICVVGILNGVYFGEVIKWLGA